MSMSKYGMCANAFVYFFCFTLDLKNLQICDIEVASIE